jgi:hypothetical protein
MTRWSGGCGDIGDNAGWPIRTNRVGRDATCEADRDRADSWNVTEACREQLASSIHALIKVHGWVVYDSEQKFVSREIWGVVGVGHGCGSVGGSVHQFMIVVSFPECGLAG